MKRQVAPEIYISLVGQEHEDRHVSPMTRMGQQKDYEETRKGDWPETIYKVCDNMKYRKCLTWLAVRHSDCCCLWCSGPLSGEAVPVWPRIGQLIEFVVVFFAFPP